MSVEFELHPQLVADCHQLGRLGEARLLLNKNAAVPWLILVPEVAQQEWLELPSDRQTELLADCSRLGAFIKRRFDPFAIVTNPPAKFHKRFETATRRPLQPAVEKPNAASSFESEDLTQLLLE